MGTDSPSALDEYEVTVCRRVTEPTPWAAVARFAERVVASLPQHRDSRSGRRNAQQVRVVLLGAGIATVVLWSSPFAPAALAICLLAFVIPISESRKRQLVAKLRATRRRETVQRSVGRLAVSPSHIELWCADERVRRLRLKGLTRDARDGGVVELRAGGKASERLVFVEADDCDAPLWVAGAPPTLGDG